MKCIINNKIVDAKIIENLGYQAGNYVKEVEYNGKLYKVISKTKAEIYREWTVFDRMKG